MDEIGVTGVILAGGKGKRFGGDKAFARLGEATLLERALSILDEHLEHTMIVTNSLDDYTGFCQARVAVDIIPGMGALGGLYTAIMLAPTDYVFAVACDMPLLAGSAIKAMISELEVFLSSEKSGEKENLRPSAIVPEHDGMLEPLHSIYSKACIGPIENLIRQGNKKILDLFPKIKTIRVDLAAECSNDIFFNVNTKADLALAEEMLHSGGERRH